MTGFADILGQTLLAGKDGAVALPGQQPSASIPTAEPADPGSTAVNSGSRPGTPRSGALSLDGDGPRIEPPTPPARQGAATDASRPASPAMTGKGDKGGKNHGIGAAAVISTPPLEALPAEPDGQPSTRGRISGRGNTVKADGSPPTGYRPARGKADDRAEPPKEISPDAPPLSPKMQSLVLLQSATPAAGDSRPADADRDAGATSARFSAPPAAAQQPEGAHPSPTLSADVPSAQQPAAPFALPLHGRETTRAEPRDAERRPARAAVSPDAGAVPLAAPIATHAAPIGAGAAHVAISARGASFAHDLGVAIARRATANGEELTVHLHPAELGRVEVKIGFEDGALRATLRAETIAALDLLRRDSTDLARAIEQAGIKADSGSFQFESRSGGNQRDGSPASPAQPASRRDDSSAASKDGDRRALSHRPVRTAGRIDLVA